MLIDTHTHLYLPEFGETPEKVVDAAVETGVRAMILPNIDESTVGDLKRLNRLRPQETFMAMGLHPTEVKDVPAAGQCRFVEEELAGTPGYVAVGEVGVDLYWDSTLEQRQMEVFECQAKLALQYGLPMIIHCRNALPQTLEVLQGLPTVPDAVFHSFGGTVDDVESIRRVGDFYFGINGIVTFKNSGLRTVLPAIGKDRLLLETDAPYLAPVPMRGRRNESAFLIHTAAYVAQALDMSNDDLPDATTASAKRLFKLSF